MTLVRLALGMVCWGAHRLWWIPGWNRVHLLTCPVGWACSKFPTFEQWYWNHEEEKS